MRLIDGDALKDRLQSLAYDDWNQGVSTSWSDAYRECADMVEDMPTIEPERETGKWIYYPKASGSVTSTAVHLYPVCSECGCEHPVANYCPNCGARMSGGEQP